jgi:hypothetical protein
VTARSKIGGYLGPALSGGPRLRLYGEADAARARVARLPPYKNERNRPEVWFEGAIHTAPEGGTVLHGTVRLSSRVLPAYVAFSVVWAVLFAGMVAAGVNGIASGSGPAFLLVPVLMTTLYVAFVVVTVGQVLPEARRLLDELCEVLGATATMEP